MNLVDQLTEVREQLAQLDNNNRDHLADISKLKAQETELTNQIALEEAELQRIQVQEEKVESISLPYDFSEVFDDPRANEMIIELLKDMRRQDFAEHNAEVSELVAAHREELKWAAEVEHALKNQIDEFQHDIETLNRQGTEMAGEITQLKYDLEDALSKRDAAVAKAEGIELLLTEKQAQIDKLRDEIAIGAVAAVKVVDVSPTDRLAKLIEESKQAKVKSALDIALENTAPFRGKVISDGQVVANLETPQVAPFQPVNQAGDTVSGLDTIYPFIVPAIDPATVEAFRAQEEVQSGNTVDTGLSSEVGESGKTLEEAFRRIEALEATVSGMNFQR